MSEQMVGRSAELATLEGFVDGVRGGPAGCVLSGEAGIGKTTLLAAALAAAGERGCEVLSCRPAQAEASLSFAALADLLAGAPEAIRSGLPAVQRRALDVALAQAAPDDPEVDWRTIAVAFLAVLRAWGREAPLIVAVDDAQWIDPPSERVLAFAARRLGQAPIRLLLCTRETAPVPLELDRGLAGALAHLRVGPLSAEALGQIVQERLGRALPRPALLRLARGARGNPFYALEIAGELGADREALRPEGLVPLPDSLQALLGQRVHRLAAFDRTVLLTVAMLSRPTPSLVRAALPGSPERVTAALAVAERDNLIRLEGVLIRFAHPLLASAIYSAAPAMERHERHRQLAEVVVDVEERARHLAMASEPPDPEVAAALEAAAAQARARGAPDAAAQMWDQARAFTPEALVESRALRSLAAAGAFFVAGDVTRARNLLEKLIAGLPPGRLRGAALRLLGQARTFDSFEAAGALLLEGLDNARDDRPLAAGIGLDLAFVLVGLGRRADAGRHAQEAMALAEGLDHDGLLAISVAVTVMTDFLLGRGLDRERLARACALEDERMQVPVQMRPSAISGILHIFVGDFALARSELLEVREQARQRGEDIADHYLLGQLTHLECHTGRLSNAAALGEEAEERAPQNDDLSFEPFAGTGLAQVYALRGRVEASRAAAQAALEGFGRVGFHGPRVWPWATLVFLHASLADHAGAHAAFTSALEELPTHDIADPVFVSATLDEVEALTALGRLAEAGALLGRLGTRMDLQHRVWVVARMARCEALLRVAQGDPDVALATANEALVHLSKLEMPFEHARTLLVKGRILRRARSKRLAAEALSGALAAFEELGIPLWAKQARGELERIKPRHVAAPFELTPMEQRVAQLATSGHTNRELAQLLFVSPKTVEAHLGRVYRKLGIRSRAQLSTALAARTDGPDKP